MTEEERQAEAQREAIMAEIRQRTAALLDYLGENVPANPIRSRAIDLVLEADMLARRALFGG